MASACPAGGADLLRFQFLHLFSWEVFLHLKVVESFGD